MNKIITLNEESLRAELIALYEELIEYGETKSVLATADKISTDDTVMLCL